MKKFTFNTSINCGKCVKTVSVFLDDVTGIKEWKVDTDNPDKVLTVMADFDSPDSIVEAVEEAGFDINARDSD
jgi:copper chaperone CopZ